MFDYKYFAAEKAISGVENPPLIFKQATICQEQEPGPEPGLVPLPVFPGPEQEQEPGPELPWASQGPAGSRQ